MVMQMKDYGWAGLMYDKTADGANQVKTVAAGSPAEAAGFKAGDLLVALNGIELNEKNHEALGKVNRKPGSTVTYTIRRGAEEKKLAVTLVQMPQDVIATNVGSHMVEAHATLATADAAAAAEAKAANAKK
jgi:C-terminal processing protease CtpA/Prc